jgi:hypothetical protein
MIDGGEGFAAALVAATNGSLEQTTVTSPVGAPVTALIGFLGGARPKTAVIEIAAAAGLRLVPREVRDPTVTTSRGVGELIRTALDGSRLAMAAARWRGLPPSTCQAGTHAWIMSASMPRSTGTMCCSAIVA